MNATKLLLACNTVLLASCVTLQPIKPTEQPTAEAIRTEMKLRCPVYRLPEFPDTPIPPSIDFSSNSKVPAAVQKKELLIYVDQLRSYIGSVKKTANTSYTKYLMACID
jgi:hypothetical protein